MVAVLVYTGAGAGAMPWSILREKSRPICATQLYISKLSLHSLLCCTVEDALPLLGQQLCLPTLLGMGLADARLHDAQASNNYPGSRAYLVALEALVTPCK